MNILTRKTVSQSKKRRRRIGFYYLVVTGIVFGLISASTVIGLILVLSRASNAIPHQILIDILIILMFGVIASGALLVRRLRETSQGKS